MDFIDAWKVAVKSKMFILIPFLFFFVFGVKVYLSFFFFPSVWGMSHKLCMRFRGICHKKKKNERIFTFCKNLIHVHRWLCSGAILIMR